MTYVAAPQRHCTSHRLVPAPTLDAVEPSAGCLTMSHKYYLVGKGFEKMAGTKAKFTAGDKSWVCVQPAPSARPSLTRLLPANSRPL